MDQHIRRLLDDLPRKPFRSKLEPHRELICELRRKRHTYQEIARFFGSHLSLRVAPSTVHNFLKVRSLLREPLSVPSFSPPEPCPPPAANQALAAPPSPTKRDRRVDKPAAALVLRSVRVLIRFLRTAN